MILPPPGGLRASRHVVVGYADAAATVRRATRSGGMSTIPGLITEINPVSRLDVPANDLDLILPHWECTIGGGCELAPNCLTADNRPVLTPLGCFAGKTRITWFFGDRAKDCPK